MNGEDPVATIAADRERARAAGDPLADLSFLATVTAQGDAAVRTLVLRDIRDNSFTLFLNQTSPKWRELHHPGGYELMLYYPSIGRQYRLSGEFRELDRDKLLPHWQARPDAAKYLDHFYREKAPQSSPVESRAWLLQQLEELRARHPDPAELAATPAASGIECIITSIDMLDLATDGGVHDRRHYLLTDGSWHLHTLVP